MEPGEIGSPNRETADSRTPTSWDEAMSGPNYRGVCQIELQGSERRRLSGRGPIVKSETRNHEGQASVRTLVRIGTGAIGKTLGPFAPRRWRDEFSLPIQQPSSVASRTETPYRNPNRQRT